MEKMFKSIKRRLSNNNVGEMAKTETAATPASDVVLPESREKM